MHRWPQASNILSECGAYQLQAVVRVHGKEVEVEELYLTPLFRERDWSIPWHMPAILRRHDIHSRWRFWLSGSFIKNLRRSIEREHPVLIVVRSIQGTGCLHWISAWGYAAATGEFLCYDSQCATALSAHGNARYSPTQLLAALPWRGTTVVEIA